MTSITVRQAVLSDLEAVAQLFNQYREFQGKEPDLQAAQAFLQARFNHGESVIFIAHEGSVPVGFAQVYPSYSSVSLARVFILSDLFVHEAGRRKGVASKLLTLIESCAWSLGVVRITLNVARGNGPGQALYEAQGWTQDAQFLMYHRFPPAAPSASPRQGSSALPRLGCSRVHRKNGDQAMINSMSYKGYTTSMVFDAEDKIIVGRVLDIDDIISFHGESVAEFESNFHAVIEDYLTASKELGSVPEKPASGRVMLRIAPEIHAAALKAAARSGTSLNKWAEGALGKAAKKPSTRAAARSEA